ncbi:ATP-binding protein [Hippea alviniae]|uniref:ATP-binding protein n=1 Tax=Hippea alviniae TaxID=1279027 RepID=UPI0003B629F8|nr:ATP-binding protein [Hippea alviniae]
MNTRTFRNKKLIDRDKEINFFLDWFNQLPGLILWVYGPKSSGKTTLIEYVVEKELFEDFENLKPKGNWWVKYINLREKLISSYETFLNSFIFPEDKTLDKTLGITFHLGVIRLDYKIFNKIKEKKNRFI